MSHLKGKTILMLCVQMFGIEQQIISKLKEKGSRVLYFDERPKNNFTTKAIIRINKNFIQKRIDNYYLQILSEISTKPLNFVFVIKGEVVPKWFISRIKKMKPETILIYYAWDAFKNNMNALNTLELYDLKFSFDPEDCKKYNLDFRPLFYPDSFRIPKIKDTNSFKFRLAFLGTLHSDRFDLFNKIEKSLLPQSQIFSYFFIQNFLVYVYKVYIEKSLKPIPLRKLNFSPLTEEEIRKIYIKSEYILDINHPNQKGLTLRTFEAIGLNRKLITTNENIRDYYFYDPHLIHIIDRRELKKLNLPINEERQNFNVLDEKFMSALSLNGWIRSIFENCEPLEFWLKERG